MPLITENMIYASLSNTVAQSGLNLQTAQTHASSGLRVLTPGDDPAAATQGSVLSTSLQALSAMDAAGKQAQTSLSSASHVLGTAQNLMARAKELAIQGASNGTLTDADRLDLATQVQALHDTLLSAVNTQENGVYIFAGFMSGTAPFASDGTYQGDNGVRQVEVTPGQSVAMNIPGNQVFNVPGGQNILGVLAQLQADLTSNNVSNIQSDMSAIDASVAQLAQGQAQLGSAMATLEIANGTRQGIATLLQNQRAALTEVDPSAAITTMMQAQSVYQSALAEATRMLSVMSNSLTR